MTHERPKGAQRMTEEWPANGTKEFLKGSKPLRCCATNLVWGFDFDRALAGCTPTEANSKTPTNLTDFSNPHWFSLKGSTRRKSSTTHRSWVSISIRFRLRPRGPRSNRTKFENPKPLQQNPQTQTGFPYGNLYPEKVPRRIHLGVSISMTSRSTF
mgnify:FL=1